MIKEFKEFISRGSVIDLAIGVIVGGAFNKIVSSLVDDIVMPLIGVIIGGINFADLKLIIAEGSIDAATGKLVGEVAVNYGIFIQNIVNFLIISFSIFMVIRFLNRLNRKKKEEVVEAAPAITTEQLLTDIKEILQKKA